MSKIDIKPLESTIAAPGTMFKVNSTIKDTTFSPGTHGFLSHIVGPDYNNPNVVFHKVVTTRRGKKGKDRLNTNIILSPIFTLPGVEIDWLIPTDKERKYLVSMNPMREITKNILKPEETDELKFISQILTRVILVIELDKSIYLPENKIMRTVGLIGHKDMNIWPTNKNSLIKRFARDVEIMYNDGRRDELIDYYCNVEIKTSLLKELQIIESCLIIPTLEYQRKVFEVMSAAIEYIKVKLNEASKTERPDKSHLLKRINITKKMIKRKEYNTSKAIDIRLKAITDNRIIL